MKVIPQPLSRGDTVAIIAPAGTVHDPARYHQGCSLLKEMGFDIFDQKKEWPGYGFLADDDDKRAEELMSAWCNPEVKALFALRGGYGSIRILEKLNYQLIQQNPKLLIGFSDISILLNTMVKRADQICLHGPVISSLASSDQISIDRLYHCLRGNYHSRLKEDVEILRSAPPVSGQLIGGNLSSLVTLLGTRWDITYEGTILFLEDVNEPLYRLDRLLTQFALAGKFDGVRGIILGDYASDFETDRRERDRIQEFVWGRVLELVRDPAVPVWGNFPAGHSSRNITLPFGIHCTMDSMTAILSFTIDRDGN